MKRALRLILCGLFCSPVSAATRSVTLKPYIGYDFVAGSGGYTSHQGTGGTSVSFLRDYKFRTYFSLFSDDDYSLIKSLRFGLERYFGDDWSLRGGLLFSWGDLKNSDTSTNSTAFDFGASRFFRRWEFGGNYRLTSGSLVSGTNREIRVTRGRNSSLRLVRDEQVERFTSHTLWATAGRDWKRLSTFTEAKLSATFSSDGSNALSEEMNLTWPLPKEFWIGTSITFTESNRSAPRFYWGLNLYKYFSPKI